MKFLIVGSKGFIGRNAQFYFASLGHEVYGCDVLVEYNDLSYFQVDAINGDYNEIFEATQFDVCINCSGAASVPDSFKHPGRDFHLNVHNVYNMLEAIRKHNPACKFINLSSAAVYGNPPSLPISEQMPKAPLSPYGWHKYYSELIGQEFYKYYNIPTCSLRIFSAYGPGLQKQLFWDWYKKVKDTDHITLFGTGRESRDFIFIDDILQSIQCIIANSLFTGEVINVGNGVEIYITEAIEIFKMQSGLRFTYSFDNKVREGDPINWRADVALLSSYGYNQQVGFEEGIKRYTQWLQERR